MEQLGRILLGGFGDKLEEYFGRWPCKALSWLVAITLLMTIFKLVVSGVWLVYGE